MANLHDPENINKIVLSNYDGEESSNSSYFILQTVQPQQEELQDEHTYSNEIVDQEFNSNNELC